MLQIKNTLGGGKPEGLYAWKKSSFSYIDNIITKANINYALGNAKSNTTVYYSKSYIIDEATGMYTLVNPKSATLQYGRNSIYYVEMVKSNYYIWGSTSSNEIYTTNASSTYNVQIQNNKGSVLLYTPTSGDYKCDIHSVNIEYTFLGYIVSDKETAYPDGGEKGGYWYEKVVEFDVSSLGLTKYEIGSFILTSGVNTITVHHSLGIKPKFFIVYGGDSNANWNVSRLAGVSFSSDNEMSIVFSYYKSAYGGTNSSSSGNTTTSITFNTGDTSFLSGNKYKYLLLA